MVVNKCLLLRVSVSLQNRYFILGLSKVKILNQSKILSLKSFAHNHAGGQTAKIRFLEKTHQKAARRSHPSFFFFFRILRETINTGLVIAPTTQYPGRLGLG